MYYDYTHSSRLIESNICCLVHVQQWLGLFTTMTIAPDDALEEEMQEVYDFFSLNFLIICICTFIVGYV